MGRNLKKLIDDRKFAEAVAARCEDERLTAYVAMDNAREQLSRDTSDIGSLMATSILEAFRGATHTLNIRERHLQEARFRLSEAYEAVRLAKTDICPTCGQENPPNI